MPAELFLYKGLNCHNGHKSDYEYLAFDDGVSIGGRITCKQCGRVYRWRYYGAVVGRPLRPPEYNFGKLTIG